MGLTLTQEYLDRAALVVVVGADGVYDWSSDKPREQIASVLEDIAHDIRGEARR
jgi:hypothetical protein